MADTRKIVFEFEATAENPATKFKSLKEEIRAIQREMAQMSMAGDVTSERFQALNARAGELKDTMGDLAGQIGALASDTPKLDLFAEGIKGISAGFQVAQGSVALFGEENEDLQKQMVKLQAVMLVTNGLTEIANMLQKNSRIATLLRAQAQIFLNSSLVSGAVAVTGFSRAMAASGIGLLVVGLGAAVALLAQFATRARESEMAVEKQAKAQEEYNRVLEIYDTQMRAVKASAEARGATEKELYEVDKRIAEGRLQLMRIEMNALKARHEASKQFLEEEIDDFVYWFKALSAVDPSGMLAQWFSDIPKASKANSELTYEVDKLTAEINEQEAAIKKLDTAWGKSTEQRSKDAQKAEEERNRMAREREQQRIKEASEISDPAMQPITDVFKIVFGMTKEKYLEVQTGKAELDKFWRNYHATERQLTDASELEQLTAALKLSGATELQIQNETEILKKQQADKWRKIDSNAKKDKRDQDKKALKEERLQALMDFGALLSGLGQIVENTSKSDRESRKKAFEFNKKLSIAATLIETYVGAQKAFSSAGNPILGALAAAAALASGLARVTAIKRQTFDAPSEEKPTETTPASAPAMITARPPDERSTGADEFGNVPGGMSQPQTIRAYVVDRDIRGAEERNDQITRFARVGF